MAKKGPRELIRLVCTEGTGHFYTTEINKRNEQAKAAGGGKSKLELKKYNPRLRRHAVYKESKIK